MKGSGDRRQYERFSLQLPAEVEYEYEDCDNYELTRLVNISAGGAYFPMSVPLKVEQRLQLRIVASGLLEEKGTQDATVNAEGVVKRVEEQMAGNQHYYVAMAFDGPVRIMQAH